MHCYSVAPQPQGAAGMINRHFSIAPCSNGRVPDLRPYRAVLGRADYWLLNEQRYRCEELGGARFTRLARLIRATLREALVVEAEDLSADVVTSTSRVTFATDHGRPQTRQLYPWHYPARGYRPLPVGSVLGVALLGMTVGHGRHVVGSNALPSELLVLAVRQPGKHRCGFLD